MTKFLRFSTMLLLGAALLVGFGCCTKSVVEEDVVVITTPTKLPAAVAALEGDLLHFEFDSYTLDSNAQRILDRNADILSTYPSINAVIEGNCDDRGTEEYNLALGERRAKAAYDYLVQKGVNPNQLSTVSYGKLHPLDNANNEAAWAMNRRDAFKVTKY